MLCWFKSKFTHDVTKITASTVAVILLAAVVSGPGAGQDEADVTPSTETMQPAAIADEIEAKALEEAERLLLRKQWKKTLLVKRKWAKKDFAIVKQRRVEGNLPEELKSAAFSTRVGDPNLASLNDFNAREAAAVNSPEIVDLFQSRVETLMESVKAVEPAAADLPDVSVILSYRDDMAAMLATGQMVLGGQMTELSNWDQVDFVLAHELVHLLELHAEKKKNMKELQTGILTILDFATRDRNSDKASGEVVIGTLASQLLINPAHSRRHEAVADKMAVDIMAWQGLAVQEVGNLFGGLVERQEQRLADYEKCKPAKKKNPLGGFLAKTLGVPDQNATQNAALPGQIPDDPCQRPATQSLLEGLTRIHSTDKTREKNINKYIAKHYPPGVYSSNPARPFDDDIKQSFFSPNSSFARSVKANKAIQLMNLGDYARGGELAEESLDPEDTNSVKPRIAMYELERHRGNFQEATSHLDVLIDGGSADKHIFNLRLKEFDRELRPLRHRFDTLTALGLGQSTESQLAGQFQNGSMAQLTPEQMQVLAQLQQQGDHEALAEFLQQAFAPAAIAGNPEGYDEKSHAAVTEEIGVVLEAKRRVAEDALRNNRRHVAFYTAAITAAAQLGGDAPTEQYVEVCRSDFSDAVAEPAEAEQQMGVQQNPFSSLGSSDAKAPTKADIDTAAVRKCEAAAMHRPYSEVFADVQQQRTVTAGLEENAPASGTD